MAIPAERYPVETVRKPGDFARHPKTGAPYVSDPTATRQPAGTKAELLAKCEARGIATPDDPKDITVKRLRELLGPEARMVQYGRPSSLGKQIENMTNLQKWSERAVALGCYLDGVSLMAEICEVGDDKLNLDDPDVRTLLDSIAVKAKNIAQAGIAAERGTHTHALTEDSDNERDWIERARSGEDLGIPEPAQRALVAAWEQMLDAEGIEILAVETAVVDDEWRQAGTLDRIARLTRPRKFTRPGGEIVTLPAGWVGVLDVKTGRLRAGKDGHPDYWHGYAVQIASYAQSVPYDPDTDTRGTWDWPIDQQYGIIAHLDVQSALDGEACCRLVLVDLAAGREAGERCVWGRSWEKRRDVFSLVVDDGVTVPVEQIAAPVPVSTVEQRAAGPEGYSTAPPVPAVDRFPGLQGVRTDCVTGVDSVVDLEYEVRVGHDGERWLHLFNGPTGYESCPVERMLADLAANPDRPGWSACAGTPKRWDRLVVTSESLLRVFGAKMVPAVDRRQLLKDRSDRIIAGCRNLDYADAIRRGGPVPKVGPHEARFRAELKAHGISPASTDDEVQAALDAIEPPFDPEPQVVVETSPPNPQPVIEPPDDGGPLDQHTLATLLTTIAASPQRAVVNAWLKQASDAGQSWNPRIHPTVRHFEIARAAFATAIAVDGGDDYARLILAHVVDEAAQPAFPVGVIFGALTIDEARRVTAIAEAFGTRLTLMCHEDGTPWLDGDVAAVLGEAVLV